jgi:hypothetical protein
VLLDDLCRGEQLLRVVGAELDDEGPVGRRVAFFAGDQVKVGVAVCFVGGVSEYLSFAICSNADLGMEKESTLALIIGE